MARPYVVARWNRGLRDPRDRRVAAVAGGGERTGPGADPRHRGSRAVATGEQSCEGVERLGGRPDAGDVIVAPARRLVAAGRHPMAQADVVGAAAAIIPW